MKRVGSILRGIVLCFLVAVITMNGILLIKRLVYKEELPSLFGHSIVTVLSGSMEPAFSPGDMLVIRKQQEYGVGEVVTYAEQGSFITHRIIEAEGDSYLTQGDANNGPDSSRIHKEDIYGAVWLVIPAAGNVVLFLKSPFGLLVMIALFLVLTEMSFWWEKRKAKE